MAEPRGTEGRIGRFADADDDDVVADAVAVADTEGAGCLMPVAKTNCSRRDGRIGIACAAGGFMRVRFISSNSADIPETVATNDLAQVGTSSEVAIAGDLEEDSDELRCAGGNGGSAGRLTTACCSKQSAQRS
jgi:hypothetical protein